MSSGPTVVIGAGGHGREVLDILRACAPALDLEVVGLLDDGSPHRDRLARIAAQHLGPVEELRAMNGALYYVGVGDPRVRRVLDERARDCAARPGPPLIHRTAHVGTDVEIGAGSVLAPGAVVTTNVRIGEHVYVGANVVVGHDSVLADYVSVYPGATISGDCIIESGVTIGTNAAVRQGTRIGAGATVGAGAVVVKDVAPGSTVVGVPAWPR